MASANKVILIGNVGKDPEIRYTEAGDPIANFSFATTEHWTNKAGEKQERTEWHRVEVFGRAAVVVRDFVKKGKQLYVEGAIKYDEYTDRENVRRYVTKIRVSDFNSKIVMLGARQDVPPVTQADEDDGQMDLEDLPATGTDG